MTRAPTDRSHLSIGEVLSLLQEEFPDVTISKIRFLESQGLLDPERTPSGYRKFYEADIDRLRWILRQQKENYLPLKVIKDRLDETGPVRTAPTTASPAHDEPANGTDHRTRTALVARPAGASANGVALDDRLQPRGRAHAAGGDRRGPDVDVADVIEPPTPPRPAVDPTLVLPRPAGGARPQPRRPERDPDPGAVALTADELAEASGLPARAVRELEGYGLLESHLVGDTSYYAEDALVIARTAAAFLEHGIEARHIRTYKVAAEREAGLFEQIVLPLLKQRNPDARRRAGQTITELIRLGDTMRSVLLRRGLRDHIPPS
ncbi:MAG TPA: MerR family transcriptional regulator [Acidimicrobiales bacterium]